MIDNTEYYSFYPIIAICSAGSSSGPGQVRYARIKYSF